MARGKKGQRSGLYVLVEQSPIKEVSLNDAPALRAMLKGIGERLSFEGQLATARGRLSQITASYCALGPQPKDGPVDSEAGFIESIGEHLDHCNRLLDEAEASENMLAVRALSAGFALAQDVHVYREEVLLGDLIAPTRGQITGRSTGGKMSAARQKAERLKTWAEWQSEADAIWFDRPDLEKADVARAVARRLGGKWDTISRRIKKTGSN